MSDRLDARDPAACYGVRMGIDCSGNVVGHRLGDFTTLCLTVTR